MIGSVNEELRILAADKKELSIDIQYDMMIDALENELVSMIASYTFTDGADDCNGIWNWDR